MSAPQQPVSSVSDDQMMTQSIAGSYVDNYTPPQVNTPAPTTSPVAPTPAAAPMQPQPVQPAQPSQPVQVSQPSAAPVSPQPAVTQTPPGSPQPKTDTKVSQALEDQNIFNLLGIQTATDQEKETFLNELQQVIWEDFVENDVDLLLTEEELVEFKKIADKKEMGEEERQAEMIDFLEKLIPDLEKIMLEKALELKEEMIRERVSDLKQAYRDQADKLSKVNQAAQLIEQQQWRAAADALNSIK